MENNLPITDIECDERLLYVVKTYVKEKNMPVPIAKSILLTSLRDLSNFDETWYRFNKMIKAKLCRVG
jgi:hypothetical protein